MELRERRVWLLASLWRKDVRIRLFLIQVTYELAAMASVAWIILATLVFEVFFYSLMAVVVLLIVLTQLSKK